MHAVTIGRDTAGRWGTSDICSDFMLLLSLLLLITLQALTSPPSPFPQSQHVTALQSTYKTAHAPIASMSAAPAPGSQIKRIFISLRFGEAMKEALTLQAALEAQGLDVFLCAVAPGDDLAGTVIHALHHCTLVVILGTATYGTKTESSCSTFQELRYVIQCNKPFFLVKMCAKFDVPEAAFRLTSDIAHYPWQPKTDVARRSVPAELVSQIQGKLQQIEAGLATAKGRAEQPAAATTKQHATIDSLAAWLAQMEFADLQPTLLRLGATTVRDVAFAVRQKHITKDELVAAGLSPLRALRFLSEAGHVGITTSNDFKAPLPAAFRAFQLAWPSLTHPYPLISSSLL